MHGNVPFITVFLSYFVHSLVQPYLRDQSDEEIREYERVPLQMNISSNTQHIERLVQLLKLVKRQAPASYEMV